MDLWAERHSKIKRDAVWFISLHSVWNNQRDAGCQGLALNRCFWEIYSKDVVPLHSWCFLHAEDELASLSSFLFLRSKLSWCHGGEEELMGIITVNKEEKLIHLLPFIDHGQVECGFITAHSFSSQTHLVNEWPSAQPGCVSSLMKRSAFHGLLSMQCVHVLIYPLCTQCVGSKWQFVNGDF